LDAPVNVAELGVVVTASVGLAPVRGAADLDDVLGRADAAMYRAKTIPWRFFVAGGRDEEARLVPDPRAAFAWLTQADHASARAVRRSGCSSPSWSSRPCYLAW
jgi:predicted signal transduction protein with EAL and GGDEF domain